MKLLIVGGFPSKAENLHGGVVTSCKILMRSKLTERFEIITVNSTFSVPPPNLLIRIPIAMARLMVFIFKVITHRPSSALFFCSAALSFFEKCFMAWLCRFLGIKTFIFPRAGELINQTTNSRLICRLSRIFVKGADIFLCQGENWTNFAINFLNIEPSRIELVPNWTATEEYLKIGTARDYSLRFGRPRLLFVGWIEDFKGIFELLKACSKISDQGIDFHLTLVGEGTASTEVKNFINSTSLSSNTDFLGWVEKKHLPGLMGKSDIFVLPSWSEGLPNSMIEALASGLAVVVTSVGSIPDYISDNSNGMIVEPRNYNSLAFVLRKIILDKELKSKLALNGFMLAKKCFSMEKSLGRLGDILEKVD